MQEFTLDVSAEEMPEGGPFHATSKVGYCDPEGGDYPHGTPGLLSTIGLWVTADDQLA